MYYSYNTPTQPYVAILYALISHMKQESEFHIEMCLALISSIELLLAKINACCNTSDLRFCILSRIFFG